MFRRKISLTCYTFEKRKDTRQLTIVLSGEDRTGMQFPKKVVNESSGFITDKILF